MPTGSHAVRNQEKILWNKKDVNPNWGLQSHQIPLNHSRNWWDRWAQHLSKHFQIELAVFNKKHIRTFGVKPWKKDHLTYHWTSARIPPIPGNLTSCFKVKVLWKENVLCIFLCTYIQLYIYIYIQQLNSPLEFPSWYGIPVISMVHQTLIQFWTKFP